MQKIETKAEVILFPCDLIPVEQIFMCYDKYNGIGDTLFGGCFGDKRSKYHQKHRTKQNTHLYVEINK